MSKIGKQPIIIPAGVEVNLEGQLVKIKGPKGEAQREFPGGVNIKKEESEIQVSISKKDKFTRSLFGTVRAIIANMVKGVSEGWSKKMELVGTGYRAEVQGNVLVLTVGYAQPVRITAPDGITFKVEKTDITIEGVDKEVVGEVAAKTRKVRPPEPYQGKGIRYKDEIVKKKAGKAAKAGEAA